MRGLAPLFLPLLALAQEPELAQIKEQELEVVREQISALKQSMDRRAAERDQITAELQTAEVRISEKRIRLAELDRERQFSERKKRDAEEKIAAQEAALVEQAALLEAQVRATYTSGSQERTKLAAGHEAVGVGVRLLLGPFQEPIREQAVLTVLELHGGLSR